jgi:hypothetical protein
MRALARRLRAEAGFVGGFEALPFGFLVFVSGTLLLVQAWAVVDANLAASAAAREAVRAFVEASGDEGTALASAEAAGLDALAGHGKRADRASFEWSRASLIRCQPVTAVVRYRVPTMTVPWLGSFGGGLIETSARHTEVVDPYRSGLAVDGFDPASCSG